MSWVFLVLIFIHPGKVPSVLIHGPYPTKALCEQARWRMQLKNAPHVIVQGCEEFRARQ